MRQVEEDIYSKSMEYFKEKTKRFNEIIKNKSLRDTILKLEEKYEKENNNKNVEWRLTDKVSAEEYLKEMIKPIPLNKVPIVVAGGSFNAMGIHINIIEEGIEILKK